MNPRPSPVRTVVAVLAVAVLLTTGLGAFGARTIDDALAEAPALDAESRAALDLESQAGDENVLVVTDTLVLLHLPADRSRVVAVALPATLEVNRPPCERWVAESAGYLDETVPAEVRTTLDDVYPVGGPRCTTKVVQQLTGLAVTRFAAFDQACTPQPGGGSASELGRVEQQFTSLATLLGEALSYRALLDPGRTGTVADALRGSVVTDGLDAGGLLALTRTLERVEGSSVEFVPLPTAREPNVRGHTVVREGEADELFDALRAGEPLNRPDVDPVAAAPISAPAEARVDVLNASDRSGAAARVGDALGELGFEVGEVGNAGEPSTATIVRHSPDRSAAAELVTAAVPAARAVVDPDAGDTVALILGSSFDDVVRTPPARSPTSCG